MGHRTGRTQVWRQLWRVVERSDVVCLVADVRNPLLHVPAALYDYCAARSVRRTELN